MFKGGGERTELPAHTYEVVTDYCVGARAPNSEKDFTACWSLNCCLFVKVIKKCDVNGQRCDILFFTRRSWRRLGTRFNVRGSIPSVLGPDGHFEIHAANVYAFSGHASVVDWNELVFRATWTISSSDMDTSRVYSRSTRPQECYGTATMP
ncbi:unnamed protein product [Peronospora destructor]|uniref:Uncharacterized protein n=1 Tax=Peronospora destructor TaxID=86335 RepID=A0AAV0V0V3_9STRA|nr:unnamed protein product [Peronospora destructor]